MVIDDLDIVGVALCPYRNPQHKKMGAALRAAPAVSFPIRAGAARPKAARRLPLA
jgi:hypothetical protein